MNLREFQHLAELRTQKGAHFSYKNMVLEMVGAAKSREHWLESSLEFVDYSDSDNRIARAKEQGRIAGRNLTAGIDGSFDY